MKKKISEIIYYLLGFILSGAFAYYVLNSILLALAFAIAVLLIIFFLLRYSKKDKMLFHNINSAYNFVNLMSVQMLSNSNVYEAYKSVENYLDVDFSNISNEDLHDELAEIANSYDLKAFKMYVDILRIYDLEGGNYKEMEEIPSSLTLKTKVYYEKLSKAKLYKLLEISMLFGLWLLIFVFIKVSIPDYYALMMENLTYQMITFAILLLGAFVFFLSAKEYYRNKIRGL